MSKSKIKVIDFYADWCSPCKALAPIVKEVESELGIEFEKVNIDQEDGRIIKYGVMSIPNIVIEKDGKVVNQLIGSQTKMGLINAINVHL